jgi:hypothetical protein
MQGVWSGKSSDSVPVKVEYSRIFPNTVTYCRIDVITCSFEMIHTNLYHDVEEYHAYMSTHGLYKIFKGHSFHTTSKKQLYHSHFLLSNE